jgi:hypothetical protein
MRPKHRAWAVVIGAGMIAFVVMAATAIAQSRDRPVAEPRPDGRLAEDPATDAGNTISCGRDRRTVVVTEEVATRVSSPGFIPVAGATATVSTHADCIIVTFSAESACFGDQNDFNDFCFVRVLDNGTPMSPTGEDFFAFDSENLTTQSHAHQWASRVTAGGAHTITLEQRTDGGSTSFWLDDWTLTVAILE